MSINQLSHPVRILRLPEVLKRIGLSRSSLYARIKEGRFPEPIKLGDSPNSASGWIEERVNDWCLERIHESANKH